MSSLLGAGRRCAALLVGALTASAVGQCVPAWQDGYQMSGLNGPVYTAVMFDDDGPGPRPEMLYVGGSFSLAGGTRAVGVARWNGTMWEGLGSGFYATTTTPGLGTVRALAVFNGELYAGGRFSRVGVSAADNIVKWAGTDWAALPVGGAEIGDLPCCAPPQIDAMITHDDGSGPALYITGHFGFAGGYIVNSVAKWDGTIFSALGPSQFEGFRGTDPHGRALASFDGDLYVGGDFGGAGATVNTLRIARWNGTAWESIGSMGSNDRVFAFHTFDGDGVGPNPAVLVVGGDLSQVGIGFSGPSGVQAFGVAQWSGSAWSAMGHLVRPEQFPDRSAEILSLGSTLEGGVPRLYAAAYGSPGSPAGTASFFHRWNGTSWEAPEAGVPNGYTHFAGGVDFNGAAAGGNALLVGGTFEAIGNTAATNFARLTEGAWTAMPEGDAPWTSNSSALNSGVLSRLVVGDEDGPGGRGPALYAFGTLVSIGGVAAPVGIARLDNGEWTPLGAGPGFKPRSVVFYDDGTGTKLFAVSIEGSLASWNGTTWTQRVPSVASVSRSATVFDADGAGPQRAAIYMSAEILNQDETDFVTAVVKWDGTGSVWTPVGSATPAGLDPRRFVYVLLPFNGHLYAGGGFVDSGGNSFYGLGRYDGADWTMVTTVPNVNESVNALEVFQGSLYVGGQFASLGGAVGSRGLARFDGTSWFGVGGGVTGAFPVAYPHVFGLGVGDDGTGPALFVGGKFETAGNVTGTRSIAKWNGSAFSPLDIGIRSNSAAGPDFPEFGGLIDTPNGEVTSIASIGGLVYVTGTFNRAGPRISHNFAAWGCPAAVCLADFNQSGSVTVQDIFDFLSAYFSGSPTADTNGAGGVTVQDIFDFLSLYFIGC